METTSDDHQRAPERPSGYSHATESGGVIALAGQVADRGVIERGEGFAAEFASALGRVVDHLERARGRPRDLLHLRIYVTDLAAYTAARPALAQNYRDRLDGHYPAATLVEVGALLDGAQVEIDGLAARRDDTGQATATAAPAAEVDGDEPVARIRLRLAPADARYAGGLVPGSKTMEVFADLETEIALREGGDEGLCVAYDMVEFLAPLRVGDFIDATARVVRRGRTSRRIYAELFKVAGVDDNGRGRHHDPPILAARASATIVVGQGLGEGSR
jgi:3-keto-5-aminohexanoate cleavage enzyme/3-aminobutyryl-CoA ammonia-lyase